VLGRIAQLLQHAQSLPTDRRGLIDRVAAVFTTAVLLIATTTGLFWYLRGAADWLAITLSVLVVSCPCALSLATPAVLAAAGGRLLRLGLLITRPGILERLAGINHIVFDKTGTLTRGQPQLVATRPLADLPASDCLKIAAALERYSRHPIARAFAAHESPTIAASDVRTQARGIEGLVAGTRYRIGAPDYIAPNALPEPVEDTVTCAVLADERQALCEFHLKDAPRPEASGVLDALRRLGIRISIASGDRIEVVTALAGELGISDFRGALTPDAKLALLPELRRAEGCIAVVGDGINDGPILAAADVGVALGGGAALSHDAASLVILNDNLETLLDGIRVARRARHIIRENLWWALGYNLVAIPAAVCGLLPPWAAALGMSLSSLLVVGNAARLAR
jgi:Cu2+-exporting ATPase